MAIGIGTVISIGGLMALCSDIVISSCTYLFCSKISKRSKTVSSYIYNRLILRR